jgi:hypothetical protein
MLKLNIIFVLFCLLNLLSCSSENAASKEQVLSQSISELEKRFEARNLSDIVEYVSENYQDEQGRTIRDIKRTIQVQLMRHKTLYVFTSIGDFTWHDDQNVTVQIAAAMAGKPIESASLLSSIRADMINFEVDFILEDEIYKVKSAVWRWANPSDFL